MLELGIGADLFRGARWVLRIAFVLAIVLALWRGRTWQLKVFYVVVIVLGFASPMLPGIVKQREYKQKYAKAKAVFDERCKTAGEKIYRTVDDVEGVLLLNVRSDNKDRIANEANPNWSDAGLPNEMPGESYIATFLQWEHHEDRRNPRGYLNYARSNLSGYRYVDVKSESNDFYRYALVDPGNPDSSKLSKVVLSGKPARYAVSFINIVEPNDRAMWVAGTTVNVTDTQTGAILATSTWYSFESGQGSKAGGRQPWRLARTCPGWRGWDGARTRMFVDQVLKPKKGVRDVE